MPSPSPPPFSPTRPIPFDPPSPDDVPSPSSSAPDPGLDLTPTDPDAPPAHGDIPNTPLAVAGIAFLLGGACVLGGVLFVFPGKYWFCRPELGFYISAWSLFHFLEFAITAAYNRPRVTVDSYLLNNGIQYHIAHIAGVVEFLVRQWFFPSASSSSLLLVSRIGMLLTLLAQLLRSAAMIRASTNFTHNVVLLKSKNHTLVTSGIYAWMRHPSYAAFFYWALGTQLALQNPLCFLAFFVVLRKFFSQRILVEERALVRFFGAEYEAYRRRVRSGLPFRTGPRQT